VVIRDIDLLKPDPKNARRHTPKQIRLIGDSIVSFGFNVPILVSADLHVIAGHGRLAAARELGLREVPTIMLDHLTEAQLRAFMIADNRLSELSSWDEKLLGRELKELSDLNLDFSLELTGFDMGKVELLIEGIDEPEGERTLEDETSPATNGPAVSRKGDLWLLGKHRLLCGDALQPENYRTLMGDAKAAMVITDPPYNVPIDGNVSGLGKVRHREFAMASGEMTEVEFRGFLERVCELAARYSQQGSLHYICMDWRHIEALLAAGGEVYDELKAMCVWVKTNAGMGSLYRSQHELVFVFKYGRSRHQNHVQLGQNGRNRTNVWEYAGHSGFGRAGKEGDLAIHPTVKPVGMIADALKDASSKGDKVLDPFLGSGTTLMAAERTGRVCYGMEIDPLYADATIRRWQSHTRSSHVRGTLERTECPVGHRSSAAKLVGLVGAARRPYFRRLQIRRAQPHGLAATRRRD
jgi:DNA modification methylase